MDLRGSRRDILFISASVMPQRFRQPEALDPFDVAVVENADNCGCHVLRSGRGLLCSKISGFHTTCLSLNAGFFHGIHHAYLPTKFITELNRSNYRVR